MNERIKDLAKLAQERAEWMTPQGLEWFDNFKEQFTRLIVQECANISNQAEQQCQHPATQILKHFGVDE